MPTPNKNMRYQNSDSSSIQNIKQNLNTFLEDFSELDFVNSVKNNFFSVATGDILDQWTNSNCTISSYDNINKTRPIIFTATNSEITQQLTLKPLTNYTVVFYGSASVSGALELQVHATDANQIRNLSADEVNSATMMIENTTNGNKQKHILTFKTIASTITGDIFLTIKNIHASLQTGNFNNVMIYSSLIELGNLPELIPASASYVPQEFITATTSADFYRGDKTFQPIKEALSINNNIAIGVDALKDNTYISNNNIAIGDNALKLFNYTGVNFDNTGNIAIGRNALSSNTTSVHNVVIGDQAGANYVGSDHLSDNTFIGQESGFNVTTGSGNTFIGAHTGPEEFYGDTSNAISIGSFIAAISNTTIIGNASVSGTRLQGDISIENSVGGNYGFIIKDRTLAKSYRLVVDNSILMLEEL